MKCKVSEKKSQFSILHCAWAVFFTVNTSELDKDDYDLHCTSNLN